MIRKYKGGMGLDYELIIQAISTIGFPIVMTGALFWKVNQQDKQHQEQISLLTDALNNNTQVMTKLYVKLGGERLDD